MSPHSNAISQRQLPLAKGFGQCRHSCYRQTQVMCCRLVVGSATYTPPRNGTRPRVLIMVTCTWTKGRFSDLSNVPWLPVGESNPGLPRDRRGYLPCYRQTQVMCCRLVVGSATHINEDNLYCMNI